MTGQPSLHSAEFLTYLTLILYDRAVWARISFAQKMFTRAMPLPKNAKPMIVS
jgi:hypothetical protein